MTIKTKDLAMAFEVPLTYTMRGIIASHHQQVPMDIMIVAMAEAAGRVMSSGSKTNLPQHTLAIRARIREAFENALNTTVSAIIVDEPINTV